MAVVLYEERTMGFNKNGEVKVYKNKDADGNKVASQDESNRYLIDDLVSDSSKSKKSKEDEESDVSN